MSDAIKWAGENAGTIGTVTIGILTATFNWAAKPRTAEELAAMSPRWAAFFRFMAGAFPDPKKVVEAVWQFANNTHDDKPKKP